MTANCLHKENESCVFCAPSDSDFERPGPVTRDPLQEGWTIKMREEPQPGHTTHSTWGQFTADMSGRPTFERCADKTLDQHVKTIYAGRGEQYGDSWDTKNACTHFTSEVYRMLEGVKRPSSEHLRLLQLASLIDVKISRMTGGYREDTIVDLIAYLAVYRTLREEYEGR